MEQLITPLTTLGHLAMLAPEQFAGPLKSLVANFIVKDLLMNDRVSLIIKYASQYRVRLINTAEATHHLLQLFTCLFIL